MQPKQPEQGRLPAAISSSSSSCASPSPPSWSSHLCDQRFFSSLRQVEARLASENSRAPRPRASPPPPKQQRSPDNSIESSLSYSAPLFVDRHRGLPPQPPVAVSGGAADPLLPGSSDPPPLELFSDSVIPGSPPSSPVGQDDAAGDLEGDVERLVELLGLSRFPHGRGGDGDGDGDGAHVLSGFGGGEGSGGFLSRIAGVKGPKCRREMERLDGWIRHYHFANGGGGGAAVKREPARLAHLLLARAACGGGGVDGFGCFRGIGFPATVEEYLEHDPPEQFSSSPHRE